MAKLNKTEIICQVCGNTQSDLLHRAHIVRSSIAGIIKVQTGQRDDNGWICTADLEKFRLLYVEKLLIAEKHDLGKLEEEVLESLRENELLTKDIDEETESQSTIGDRLADRIAAFGGSWKFIIIFAVIIFSWMFVNTYILVVKPFDPYPLILLNLVLSSLAVFQAPIIMMSQNRQENRDRLRSDYDYQVNLKAELEIRQLNQKIDHLLSNQWEGLLEIQEIQLEMLKELIDGQ